MMSGHEFQVYLCFSLIIAVLYIDALIQDCSTSSALTMEILQSCTKPPIYNMDQIVDVQLHFI